MVETQPVQTAEQEICRKRVFQLAPTKARIDISDKTEGTHSIFRVRLFPEDTRLIENIQMRPVSCCPETKTVELEFEQIQTDSPYGFKIEDVRLECDRILIGADVAIACRKITSFGQAIFIMSAARNIIVRSKERMPQN